MLITREQLNLIRQGHTLMLPQPLVMNVSEIRQICYVTLEPEERGGCYLTVWKTSTDAIDYVRRQARTPEAQAQRAAREHPLAGDGGA